MKSLRIMFVGFLGLFGLGSALSVFLCMVCIGGIVGMFCWPYGVNTWLVFAGREPSMLWWHGFIIGMVPVFGKLSIPLAIITWIVMMFL